MSPHKNGKDRFSNDVVYQNTVIGSSLDEALFNLKYKYNKDLGNSRKFLLITMHDAPLDSDKNLITGIVCSRKYPTVPGAAS